jgi:signal transduction histidine kinase
VSDAARLAGRILAVDDNPQNLALLRAQLERAGYDVATAAGGEEALRAAAETSPDLVLLDLLMPGMDGNEVCRRLRHDPTTLPIPIVMLTALRDADSKAAALAAGADDFLTKPFDRAELLARVASLVRSKRLYDEVARSRVEVRALNAALEERVAERTAQLEAALSDLKAFHQHALEQERLRALGEMASGIAHDLNNALAPVVGFAELLVEQPASLADSLMATRYLGLILAGARDAAETVRRLRQFYRPRSEGDSFEPVDLVELAGHVVDLTEPKWKDQAQAAGASVAVRVEGGPVPVVAGDPAELREALTNLVFNAVDALPAGGTITIRVHEPGPGRVALSVADTGTGMPDDVRRRALEPFFTTKGERGTGLGLAMVHGIVNRHGGSIDIRSRAGHGTAVSLVLPVWQAEAAAATDGAEPAAPRADRRLSVLVVDDEDPVRAVTAAVLTSDGHHVVEASSASEALDAFAGAGEFDVVVTDRAMPGLNGDQLALEMKRRRPGVPVVMLTGFGALMNGEGPAGVDALLSKPVTRAALRRTLWDVVERGPGCYVEPHAGAAE